ncbi:MAG: alpha/beta fold hydrolase [Planctomycetes bacterium]|nr:alpha/beta fold hydrolase [Planctomycetota bacterium]
MWNQSFALATCSTLFFVMTTADAGGQKKPAPSFEPEVVIQDENYRDVRERFRTKLLKKGAAPQKAPTLKTPSGVTEVEFPSGELRLKAWINHPENSDAKKLPAVVFLHGGFAFDKEDWDMAKPYRDAGYVVMAPILRGENGQAGDFSLFYDEVGDVLAAAEYLSKQPYADSERLFVAGHSVGGTHALLAAMASNRFRAAASFSGSPDQVLYCKYGINKASIPFDTTIPKELEVRSPLAYAKSFACPARLYFGTKEKHFEKTSMRTASVAKEKGLDVEAIAVEGDHMSAVPGEMKQSIAFFDKVSNQSPKRH